MKLVINISNRWLYTIIAIGVLVIIGVGVYAYVGPGGVGHDIIDIEPCLEGEILQTSTGGVWTCVDIPGGAAETDPTVPGSIKDGIDWSELSNIPLGFVDEIDNTGITTETDPTVQTNVKDGVTWTELTGIPGDIADGDDVGAGDNLGNHIATQDLNLDYNKITNLNPPTSNRDAATKAYVDAQAGGGGCYWDHDSACPSGFTQKDSDVQYLCSNSVNLGSSSLHTVVLPVGEACPSGFVGKFNLGSARLCCMS